MTPSGFDVDRFIAAAHEVRQAIAMLALQGFKIASLEQEFQDRMEVVNHKPTQDDLRFPYQPAENIGAHLVGHGVDERPPLSGRLVVGRAYSLTPGQRDVLRERYGLTPTRTVIVTGFNTYEPTHPHIIRWVTIRSNMHVDDVRKHILISATIGDWGTFMATAVQRDRDRTLLKESAVTEDVADEVLKTKFKTPKTLDLMKLYGLE